MSICSVIETLNSCRPSVVLHLVGNGMARPTQRNHNGYVESKGNYHAATSLKSAFSVTLYLGEICCPGFDTIVNASSAIKVKE